MSPIKEEGVYEKHKTNTDHTVLYYDDLPMETAEIAGQTLKHKVVRILFDNPVIPDDIKIDESQVTSWTSTTYSVSRNLNDSLNT